MTQQDDELSFSAGSRSVMEIPPSFLGVPALYETRMISLLYFALNLDQQKSSMSSVLYLADDKESRTDAFVFSFHVNKPFFDVRRAKRTYWRRPEILVYAVAFVVNHPSL